MKIIKVLSKARKLNNAVVNFYIELRIKDDEEYCRPHGLLKSLTCSNTLLCIYNCEICQEGKLIHLFQYLACSTSNINIHVSWE